MTTILAISGSPSATSKTTRVLSHLAGRLGIDAELRTLAVRDLPAEVLLGADPSHPVIVDVAQQIQAADGLIVATPVYKAAYSGILKALLDLLPQYALAGKTVLPLATGGTVAHVLAIDYALRPVLTTMGAAHVVPGYFLHDKLITDAPDGSGGILIEDGAQAMLDGIVATFIAALAVRVPSVS
jgi:FMN reductase